MFACRNSAWLIQLPQRELHHRDWTLQAETADRALSIVAALPPLAPAFDFGVAPS